MTNTSFSLGGEAFVAALAKASEAAELAAQRQQKIDLLSSANMKPMLDNDSPDSSNIILYSETLKGLQHDAIKQLLVSGDIVPREERVDFFVNAGRKGERFFSTDSFPKGEIEIGEIEDTTPTKYFLRISGDELIGKLADMGVEFEGSQQAKKVYREHVMPVAEKGIRDILKDVNLKPLRDARTP